MQLSILVMLCQITVYGRAQPKLYLSRKLQLQTSQSNLEGWRRERRSHLGSPYFCDLCCLRQFHPPLRCPAAIDSLMLRERKMEGEAVTCRILGSKTLTLDVAKHWTSDFQLHENETETKVAFYIICVGLY